MSHRGGSASGTVGRQRTPPRASIRRRLALSHAAAVTASTFVYAAGGFVLLVLLLYLVGGYDTQGMMQLVPQFMGVTIFVLIQIALITLCGIVVARVASTMVSAPMLRQIAELEHGSDAIASGNLDRRVQVITRDELGQLAERFNYLSMQLQSADKQRRAFVANISHDLRTPIAVILGHLETQTDSEGSGGVPVDESFAAIAHEVQTLSRLIDDLFTHSRIEEGVLPVASAVVDIAPIANEVVSGLRGVRAQDRAGKRQCADSGSAACRAG